MRVERFHNWFPLSAVLWLLMGIFPLFAQSPRTERIKPPFPSLRLSRHFHSEEAVQALGANLPAVAAWYGKSAGEMAKLLRHNRSLWVSPSGRLMYACELDTPSIAETAAIPGAARSGISSFSLDQTFLLHSLPGSKKTIYLDFNGGTISGTAWNAGYNGGADIIAAPFELDGFPGTFSVTELQMIQNIWKRVAEDYAPFDVDVTTEEPAADALTRSSSSDDTYGNRVMITPTNFYPNAGGVSFVGAFNDVGEYYKTSWAFSNMLANGEKYIAEACSHENGHSVGLHHEGTTSGDEFYSGQGDWAPIMGNSYYRNVTQWAKGEYAGANNTEDQLQVMQNHGLTYFTDDHGDTAETATQLAAGSAISESGFIERNTDVDVFRLEAEAGIVSIGVTPAPLGPNLKILAEFLDSGGNVLISSSKSDLSAAIRTTIPAGTYYLRISGVGSGDPATTGYSNYGSLGQYVLEGTTGSSAIPPTALILPGELSGEAPLGFWFTGSDSTDDGTITSYAWNFGDGSTSSYPNPYHEFTSAGVFTVTLTVTDDDGLTGSASATVTVTKQQVHVKSIWLTPTSSSTAVSATATVMIANSYDTPISGAIVTGSWSGVVQETLSAVTDMSAVATFKSPQSLVSGTFTFTVTDVSALGCTYNVQQNNQTSASIFGSPIDTIAPSITIIAPQEGAKVAGTVSISVDASDDVGVIKVALYVDGRLTAISTIPPFKTRWDGRMSKGGHTIRTVAYDAAGNSSSSPTVTVYKR